MLVKLSIQRYFDKVTIQSELDRYHPRSQYAIKKRSSNYSETSLH